MSKLLTAAAEGKGVACVCKLLCELEVVKLVWRSLGKPVCPVCTDDASGGVGIKADLSGLSGYTSLGFFGTGSVLSVKGVAALVGRGR